MCGVAGIVDYEGRIVLDQTVRSMVHRLGHRGPDDCGQFVYENVALGHTRLSIIDHDGGVQPMSSVDGKIHLTFNGEIYNFRELRRKLERKGHMFRTHSDTEVILYAYREWGKHCVDYLEGMFAFAIADFTKQEVFLARDPFGVKPLLYRVQKSSFSFASEFQALWALPDWKSEIDLMSIDIYLRYQYIPAPNTVFRNVFKLPAGHCMTVRMGESHQKVERYWQPDFSSKKQMNDTDLIDSLDDALRDSVRRHLVADVPFGALLSGGVDSSLIVGYMAEIMDEPVKTFSIGFENKSHNELPYARIVAKKYGTEHHEEIVRFDALDILPEVVKHHGEPFGDQSAIPTWYVSKLARTKVPMVLSGDGGDELFAGYGTYGHWLAKIDNINPKPDTSWKRYVRPALRKVIPSRYPKVYQPEDESQHWTACVNRFTASQREELWRPELRFLSDQESQSFEQAFDVGRSLMDVNRTQRVDMETYLPENILCKVDISSMRHGLEVRPPILDRKFFDFCRSIHPSQLYCVDNKKKEYCGKLPLKHLLAKKLGHKFAFRPKQGFEVPLQNWFSNAKEEKRVRDRLTAPGVRISEWFDLGQIHATIDHGNFFNVWLLLVLEEWCNQLDSATTSSNIELPTCISG